ncbi:NAD-dependent epimerase/dehydratase family protein [Candidatus Latescibacterota bacterium]
MTDFTNRKVLVTGGTGFIGSALVKRLVKDGVDVRVLDNDLRGAASRLDDVSDSIDLVQADIRDASAVSAACSGMEAVIHLAYLNGTEYFYSKPDLVLDIGVKGMVNVIDGCRNEGIKELFLASTSEVYQTPRTIPTDESAELSVPDPLNPRYSYGGGKIISELMTINYGRKYFDRAVIFRPHNVYGPNMGWEHVIPQFSLRMKKVAEKSSGKSVEFLIQGSGKETRSFVYIDDFIDGVMLLLDKGEHLGIYHIGTMDEITIAQAAVEVGRYFGKDVTVIPGELLKGGTLRRCPDITKMKDIGYSPKISFQDGFARTVKWYDEHSEENRSIDSGR